jgi:hypothetical protein
MIPRLGLFLIVIVTAFAGAPGVWLEEANHQEESILICENAVSPAARPERLRIPRVLQTAGLRPKMAQSTPAERDTVPHCVRTGNAPIASAFRILLI